MKHTRKRLIISAVSLFLTLALCVGGVGATGYLTTTVIKLNSAPVAENLDISTYRGVEISGTFKAVDPEGDLLSFSVTQYPKKGGVTAEGDSFTYTPTDGKKGKDTFKYVAIDSFGNISNEATVTVSIKKQVTDVSYSDLDGSPYRYAATYLAEKGVFLGEKVGGKYLFSPDETVTRGEFLAMCLELAGTDTVKVARTGFYDDDEIPLWQKPYVAAAVLGSIVNGSVNDDGRIVFSASDPVTYAQAAVILNNTLGVTNVKADESEDYPTWAAQAVANLSSCDIIETGTLSLSSKELTRGEAAKMLLGAAKVLEGRK